MEQKMKEMGLSWPRFEKNEMVDLITYIRPAAQSQGPQKKFNKPKARKMVEIVLAEHYKRRL
jgi:hypothetical protein